MTRNRILVVRASIAALALFAGGCGGGSKSSGGESGATAQLTSSRSTAADERETAETRPVRWSVVAERRHALQLGLVLPYCGNREPKPFIERVERRHGRGGLVFTVFVRFGPESPESEGCVGEELFPVKWVRIGDKSKPLFDGSTSPPSRRQLPP
jgi:hypothetical protein